MRLPRAGLSPHSHPLSAQPSHWHPEVVRRGAVSTDIPQALPAQPLGLVRGSCYSLRAGSSRSHQYSPGTLLPAPSGLRGTGRDLVIPGQSLDLIREAALEARTRRGIPGLGKASPPPPQAGRALEMLWRTMLQSNCTWRPQVLFLLNFQNKQTKKDVIFSKL